MTRTQIIQALIDRFDFKSYLEIGVHTGYNFHQIRCDAKQSVDPKYPATFQVTSDEYFTELPGYIFPYDLIFIDGLHTEQQVYKDLTNSLECVDENGFIIVHDCNPATEWATRPSEEYKQGEIWNGTTYKGFIRFKSEHPELTCFTVDTDFGCGVITDRSMLKNNAPGIIGLTWDHFDKHRTELLQLISVDEFNQII